MTSLTLTEKAVQNDPAWLGSVQEEARRVAGEKALADAIESGELSTDGLMRFATKGPTIIQSGRSSSVSGMDWLPPHVTFTPIKESISGTSFDLKRYFNQTPLMHAASSDAAVNLATFEAGVFLRVGEGVELAPVRHVLVSDANLVDRSIIICEPGSRATLIIEGRSIEEHPSHRNGYLEIHLAPGAHLTLIDANQFNEAVSSNLTTMAVIGKGATIEHITASLGGAKDTTSTTFHIIGDHGSVNHRHVTLSSGNEHHLSQTSVLHSAPHGRSTIAVKNVAQDTSSVISHSNVTIESHAGQTVSKVTDHTLILDPHAKGESIPSMEISANDVQAGHAASTCQLNNEHVFYLCARGIDETTARRMIVLGFLEEALSELELPIDINALLEERFDNANMDPLATGINRDDFPILSTRVNRKPLAYLDNAATTHKPRYVIEAITSFYEHDNSNIHRGLHTLSERSTAAYESARKTIAGFINAKPSEIIFVRNTTEGINLIAQTLGRKILQPADRILLTELEHHSNIVPWQMIAGETRAKIDVVEVDEHGVLSAESLRRCLAQQPKIVALTHVSNALGTINPVKAITSASHANGALVIIDAAQSVPHMPVDVKDIDCDIMVFSGHKMLGPTGIGVLYVKQEILSKLPPHLGGGGMIKEVSFAKTTFKDGPEKFEAGTPNIAGAIGLAAAVDYLQKVGMENVRSHNDGLLAYAWDQLAKIPQVTLYGPRDLSMRSGSIAFNLGDIHAHDVSTVLDEEGVAVRAGHHCAMPLMEKMRLASTCRASFHLYNSTRDVDQLIGAIHKAITVFGL